MIIQKEKENHEKKKNAILNVTILKWIIID